MVPIAYVTKGIELLGGNRFTVGSGFPVLILKNKITPDLSDRRRKLVTGTGKIDD